MQLVSFPDLWSLPRTLTGKLEKKILRYIAGTIDYGLWYTTFEDNILT
jgi:hypothetical protein